MANACALLALIADGHIDDALDLADNVHPMAVATAALTATAGISDGTAAGWNPNRYAAAMRIAALNHTSAAMEDQ
jgi:hypothetical protein